MKKILILAMLTLVNVHASIVTNVVHIEKNEANHEIFVTYNGRVFEVNPNRTNILDTLNLAKVNDLKVELEIETGEEFKSDKKIEKILSAKLIETYNSEVIYTADQTPMDNYTASNVDSYEKALKIFKTLNTKTRRRSQCFNRAHIWAKHMNDEYQVDSMKILIYYTKKYRKEVSKKWWFHIAPMIDVNGQYYVMDREFTRAPVTNDQWEKIFIKKIKDKSYRCKKIDNIKEYYDSSNTNTEFCNIQYTSMYYWEPNDMARLDKKGSTKTDWVNWELRISAKQGFKKWKEVYKERKI